MITLLGVVISSCNSTAMIFVGCAAFVAATTSIYPTTNVQADEGSTLAITCSFRKDFGQYQMSVNGDRTGNIIDLSAGNISRPLSLLTGFYIVRRVSPRVEVDFLVTASRAANEFRLRCLFVPTDKPEEGSYIITLTINCKKRYYCRRVRCCPRRGRSVGHSLQLLRIRR